MSLRIGRPLLLGFVDVVVIDLLSSPLSSLLPPCPHLLLPVGSQPCFPDMPAKLGTEVEASFLLASVEGKKTKPAAVACQALGAVVGLCSIATPRAPPRMVRHVIYSH